MNAIIKFVFPTLLTLLCLTQTVSSQIGERCEPGDIPPHLGLTCQATGEWEYQPSYILNAKKGEILLSPGRGLIGGLLRHVVPPQRFSHTGMIVNRSPMLFRNSTAADARYPAGAGSDGFAPDILKYGWPGTITETIDEAYFGHWLTSPEGTPYFFTTLNRNTSDFRETGLAFPMIVKPLPDIGFWDELSS